MMRTFRAWLRRLRRFRPPQQRVSDAWIAEQMREQKGWR